MSTLKSNEVVESCKDANIVSSLLFAYDLFHIVVLNYFKILKFSYLNNFDLGILTRESIV